MNIIDFLLLACITIYDCIIKKMLKFFTRLKILYNILYSLKMINITLVFYIYITLQIIKISND